MEQPRSLMSMVSLPALFSDAIFPKKNSAGAVDGFFLAGGLYSDGKFSETTARIDVVYNCTFGTFFSRLFFATSFFSFFSLFLFPSVFNFFVGRLFPYFFRLSDACSDSDSNTSSTNALFMFN